MKVRLVTLNLQGRFKVKNAATADICQIHFFIYQNPCLFGGKILILGVTFLGGVGWRESKILIMMGGDTQSIGRIY